MEELNAIAHLEIPHSTYMLKVVMADVKVENDDFSKLGGDMFKDENANVVGTSYFKRIFKNFELFQKYGFL